MRRRSVRREREERAYAEAAREYLRQHPFCQAWLLLHGVRNEAEIVAEWNRSGRPGRIVINGRPAPFADQVHHRNKRRGARLSDRRWWLATCAELHARIEGDKAWARRIGLLLPLEADADGRLLDKSTCPTTDELLTAGMGA